MKSMQRTYGGKKGEQVFYATRNAGKIEGVEEKKKGGKVGKGRKSSGRDPRARPAPRDVTARRPER